MPGHPIAVADDPSFDAHEADRPHPERPGRLRAVRRGLAEALPVDHRLRLEVTDADRDDLLRIHRPDYLRDLERALGELDQGYLDPDTYFNRHTRTAAWRAAGAAVGVVDALLGGAAEVGIATPRPPGHHATPTGPMGFCLLNNVSIAASHALARGAAKVAILDWDVHHGNGTQDAFYADPRVLFLSVHQWPLFPGAGRPSEVGRGRGEGSTINVALPAGAGGAAYGAVFERLALPLFRQFAPDLVLVSMGFDAHERDPIGSMCLDAAAYGAMATALMALGHPVAFVLEGGYDLDALAASTRAVGHAMMGRETALPGGAVREADERAIGETLSCIKPYWPKLGGI